MLPLAAHDPTSLADQFAAAGLVRSHADKVLRRFYGDGGEPTLSVESVGKGVVRWMESARPWLSSRIVRQSDSADGTTKLLVETADRKAVECVLMPTERADRTMACVSSQVGCAMRCDFCASTRGGLERDLSTAEIVEQFLHLTRVASARQRRITSVVFMGMGEPMLNLDSVLPAIRRIGDSGMGGVGWRQITVSTVGIVPGIHRLADADLNVHLALSLHAPDDETRARLIPMNRRYPVAEVLAAARRFFERSRRIVTIEYCLLAGVNDSDRHASLLATLLEGFRAHVNLIPYNPIGAGLSGIAYERPTEERVGRFLQLLRDAGVVSHVRKTRGDDVSAACGQLRETFVQIGL